MVAFSETYHHLLRLLRNAIREEGRGQQGTRNQLVAQQTSWSGLEAQTVLLVDGSDQQNSWRLETQTVLVVDGSIHVGVRLQSGSALLLQMSDLHLM